MRVVAAFVLALGLASALNVDISLGAAQINPLLEGSKLGLTVSVKNTLSTPITLLKWNTPFDDASSVLKGRFLRVEKDSERAIYTGILAKRIATADDFLTLHAGESLSTTIDVLKGYAFTSAGMWNISVDSYFNWAVGFEHDLNSLTAEHVVSPVASLKVAAPSVNPFDKEHDGLLGGVTVKDNCDNTQTTTVKNADTNAQTMAGTANKNTDCTSSYYTTWFGACNSNREGTVSSNQNKILTGLQKSYSVDCAGPQCSANTYAYVYPTDTSHTVYVCGAFWNAGSTCKYDSQRGTLIHEMSHFNDVAGTDDLQYGTTGCRNLATNNPAQAIRNADSYEYFNEGSGCNLS